ncbi:unnamed protein product [Urochloa humidicola]
MDPCPFVRVLVGNLALRMPVAPPAWAQASSRRLGRKRRSSGRRPPPAGAGSWPLDLGRSSSASTCAAASLAHGEEEVGVWPGQGRIAPPRARRRAAPPRPARVHILFSAESGIGHTVFLVGGASMDTSCEVHLPGFGAAGTAAGGAVEVELEFGQDLEGGHDVPAGAAAAKYRELVVAAEAL